ncbi:speckle-type POZ protein B-like [Trichogramma pretiosum]|uniref:speckle-type POZ protein B-like n=1 Tax=Trichogramma pretiosum TaxID=7493 RepID=UPI0006C9CFC2|nr:speckle-type POZ protein B-like [Trichogramma pretiosum]
MSSKQIKACTEFTSDKCTFTWTIKNYRLLKMNNKEKIRSPIFGVGNDNKKYFFLDLYPEGECEDDEGFVSFFITPVIDKTKKPDKLVCKLTVSVVNDEEVIQKLSRHYDFATKNFIACGRAQFHELKNIDKLVSAENTVTIQCELEVLDQIQSSLNSGIICIKDETIYTTKFDFSFLSEKLSDVKLKVEEQEIPAHKIVLAAVSPVFRTKFTHDMLENEENFVKITDTTANVVIEMLRFIYTGQINAIETKTIIELLAAADEYQIDSLKIKCSNILSADMSSENAVDILVAAHKYKVKHLEDEAIEFVTNHSQLLSNYTKMKKIDDPDIWMNLTQSILQSQNLPCPVCHPENHC